MNKNVLNIIVSMILFCSCSSDEPYQMPLDEFPPIKLYFTYTNEAGEDLLDPSNPNNVLSERTRVDYKDATYYLDSIPNTNPNGEESTVDFRGLKLGYYRDKYALIFGELDGSHLYKDEQLEIGWGNGYGYSILIYSIWTYDKNGLPKFYRKYTNGSNIIAEGTATPVISDIYIDLGIY